MRKTIYVPSEEVWEDVKRRANGMNLSVSQYLLGGKHIMAEVQPFAESMIRAADGQLDRIESKLDAHIAKNDSGNSSQLTQGRFGGGGRKIKKEKIETVKNMMGRSGAIPKGGKK